MRKRNIAILLIFISMFPLSAQDKQSSVAGYWCDRDSLSNDIGQWIEFRDDMTYTLYSNTPFGTSIKGAYQINGNRVVTYPEMQTLRTEMESREYIPSDLIAFAQEWILLSNTSDMAGYRRRLVGEGGTVFWDRSSFVEPGRQKSVNGINMVTVEKSSCFIGSNTNLRTGPGLGYEKQEISRSGVNYPFLPRDSKVILIGRSLRKEAVDGMNDYWFYVDTLCHPIEDSGPEFGWIYGGLLDRSSLAPVSPMIYK